MLGLSVCGLYCTSLLETMYDLGDTNTHVNITLDDLLDLRNVLNQHLIMCRIALDMLRVPTGLPEVLGSIYRLLEPP